MKTTFGTTEQSVICLIDFLKNTFKDYTGKDLTVSIVRNKDDMRSFGSAQNPQTNGKPTVMFPFMKLAYATYQLDTTRGGGRKHTHIAIGKDDSGKTTRVSFMPVKIGLGAKFQSDNIDDVIRFCHMLAAHYPAVAYFLEYENGFKSMARINFESQFNIAEANLSSPGDTFDWETTFIIDILEGDLSTMPSIKSVSVKTYLSNGYGKTVADASVELVNTLNLRFPAIHNVHNDPYLGAYDAKNSKL